MRESDPTWGQACTQANRRSPIDSGGPDERQCSVDEHRDGHAHEPAGFDLWDPADSTAPRSARSRRMRFLLALLVLLAIATLAVGWALLRSDITEPALVGIGLVA